MSSWKGSNRGARLPKNWQALRAQVKARANGRCENIVNGARCNMIGNQCDHIIRGDDHSLMNLQWLCVSCHAKKSSSEGGSAKRRRYRRYDRTRRAPEPHPGIVR